LYARPIFARAAESFGLDYHRPSRTGDRQEEGQPKLNYRIFAPMMIAIALLGLFWGLAEYFGPRLLNIPSGSNDSSGSQGTANMNVTLLIDFGNGTKLWFNDTKVARTDNFYTVTYNDVRGDL